MKLRLLSSFILLCISFNAFAQFDQRMNGNTFNEDDENAYTMDGEPISKRNRNNDSKVWGRDTTDTDDEEIPIGQFQWIIDPRLGTVIDAENNDTVVQDFQNWNNTDGYTGQYSYLGNLSSPRLNRIFMRREEDENFLFLTPFSYFRGGLQDFRFTNTLSPITNLAYHSCGTQQNGEDRVRAYFASNISKISGIGFKVDYSYGRGYYNNCANSLFGGTLYGYYRGEHYSAHAYVNINHLKMSENGGIEDDKYITDPQSFSQSYNSTSIPVILSDTWNRNHEQNYYLTHRYNLGFNREIEVPDSLKPQMPSDMELLDELKDSLFQVLQTDSIQRALVLDSLRRDWQEQQVTPTEFIPVSSIIHTFDMRLLEHSYLSRQTPGDYYTNHYYGSWNDVHDDTRAMSLRNTIGISLREGFHKWAKMGLTAFATHQLRNYTLPELRDSLLNEPRWTESDISIGAELARRQGKVLNYNATGELWMVGERAGDFDVNGNGFLNVGLGKFDTLQVDVHGRVANTLPGFYYRHYHSQSTWWDNSLDREFRTRVDGDIRFKRLGTRFHIGFENIGNYTHFAIVKKEKENRTRESLLTSDYTHAVEVRQSGSNVQVFSATLAQDLKFGPLHWDSEVTYQACSDKDILPLPTLTLYTNVYFLFRIAKVLRVQIGGDMRYFTEYYAPDYAPSISQFAVQDASAARVKIGNYPIINAYANLHLKHCRLYVNATHVNQGNGRYFLAPHYPINPMSIHFGLSWNFFN